jgi:2-keto-4-pentenoate hydratase/2-oxohepta-3-ene-1,7-dioic acid hydratase in catechol pathway
VTAGRCLDDAILEQRNLYPWHGRESMRLMRFGQAGGELPAAYTSDGVYDLRSLTADIDGAFLAADGIARTRGALASGTLARLGDTPEDVQMRVAAPLARPAAIVCLGQNYAAHAVESGVEPPTQPIIFLKHPNTIVGPYDDVHIPRGATRTDWEVELAVVMGRTARYLDSPDDAVAHVAGFTASNDVSEREFQLEASGGQWSKGKCCETFNPLGPWLVPTEDVGDPQNLPMRSWVNGEIRQDSTSADMIFRAYELVWHLSQYLVLDPGDIINTGTPQGVALSGRYEYLKPGDVMELQIDRLGHQRQRLVLAP